MVAARRHFLNPLGGLALLPPSRFCLFVGKCSLRSLLFIHASLLPRLPDCHQSGPFLCFEVGALEADPGAMGSLGLQSSLPWDLGRQIPEQTEICSCKSRICWFSCSLLLGCSAHVSWLRQLRLLLPFMSLSHSSSFLNNRCSRASLILCHNVSAQCPLPGTLDKLQTCGDINSCWPTGAPVSRRASSGTSTPSFLLMPVLDSASVAAVPLLWILFLPPCSQGTTPDR